MKLAIIRYGAVLIFLIISAAALMHISGSVQQLERDIVHYERAIDQEKEKIRVLKAEWAYLNNPERLEALAAGGYDMHTPKTDALISDPARLPNMFTSEQDALNSITPASGVSPQNKRFLHPQKQGGRE